jgi:diaminopimelate decarboxylase
MNILVRTQTNLAERLLHTHFGVRDGELLVGGVGVRSLVSKHGSPLYAYDADIMRKNYRRLAAALEGFADIYYSVKANPNPEIARLLVSEGAGLEIASGGELSVALRAGCPAHRVLFAGPAKGREELEHAVSAGIGEIHLETMEEIDACADIALSLGRKVEVAIRINPGAAAQGGAMRMGGKPAAFGFDEEDLAIVTRAVLGRPGLVLTGIHLFAGTQVLEARTLLAQWSHVIVLAAEMARIAGHPLKTIDFGGGLGVPYHPGDPELDLDALSSGLPALRQQVAQHPLLCAARLLVEPGRFLTAAAGVYLATTRAQKTSRGTRFVITDGGMHHHLAASGNLGQVVKRDYPILAATRIGTEHVTPAVITGPLCTPLDTIGRQTPLPDLRPGDIIAILQSGAYGLTASPVGFLSHPMPAEVLMDGGVAREIRPRCMPFA